MIVHLFLFITFGLITYSLVKPLIDKWTLVSHLFSAYIPILTFFFYQSRARYQTVAQSS